MMITQIAPLTPQTVKAMQPEMRPAVWQLQRLKPAILAPQAMRILMFRFKI
jgi:hypothetical protein